MHACMKFLQVVSLASLVVFALAVKVHVATFTHDDFLAADVRYQKMKAANLGFDISNTQVHGSGSVATQAGPLSNQLMTLGWYAELSLVCSLVLSVGTLFLEQNLPPDLAKNRAFLRSWLFWSLNIAALGALLCGVFLFFMQLHKAVIASYPLYASHTKGINDGLMQWNFQNESFGVRDFVEFAVNDGVDLHSTLALTSATLFTGFAILNLLAMAARSNRV